LENHVQGRRAEEMQKRCVESIPTGILRSQAAVVRPLWALKRCGASSSAHRRHTAADMRASKTPAGEPSSAAAELSGPYRVGPVAADGSARVRLLMALPRQGQIRVSASLSCQLAEARNWPFSKSKLQRLPSGRADSMERYRGWIHIASASPTPVIPHGPIWTLGGKGRRKCQQLGHLR